MADRSDAELLAAAQAGHRDAFSDLVLRHQDRIYRLALKFVRRPDLAEDVAQRVFLNAYARLAEFKAEAAFTTWLYRIAFNESVSTLRYEKRRRMAPIQEGAGEAPAVDGNPSEAMEREEARSRVQAALARIDPEDRALLLMREMEGLDYSRIAQVLEVPVGTVRSRLHRAREALRAELATSKDSS